jgi:hypothetical protein
MKFNIEPIIKGNESAAVIKKPPEGGFYMVFN